MEYHKKKGQTVNAAHHVKVKKEKSDMERTPQPMSHYIDDRLELVKQVFGSLKPKTILNLAPDFLKVKTLEEIEEACLNELLCISTKRLKSIITASKCPTDTETSEEDSDVECGEEHISLEEISSDSEIEGDKLKKGKKKKSSNSTAESGAKININNNNKPNENDTGQISVLELLELQARARAIRSQLALEPITKIEVDSDDEKKSFNSKNKDMQKPTNKYNKRSSSEQQEKNSTQGTLPHNLSDAATNISTRKDETSKNTVKKIKLKRNYRRPSSSKSEETQLDSINEKMCENANNVSTKTNRGKNDESKLQIKQEQNSTRSPSPDVIPIVLEPETLLISDSSEGEEDNKNVSNVNAREVNIEKTNDGSMVNKGTHKDEDVSEQQKIQISNQNKKDDSEPEDGEVIEDEVIEDEVSDGGNVIDASKNNIIDNCKDVECKRLENDIEKIDSFPTKEDLKDGKDSAITIQVEMANSCDIMPSLKCSDQDTKVDGVVVAPEKSGQTITTDEDDDQNDDIISLEGGDLENEIIEHLQNVTSKNNSSFVETEIQIQESKSHEVKEPDDIISLESSEDELTKNAESWQSRYMKSSKISKVLATSRLGKRVRDKIKKSKASNSNAAEDKSDRVVENQEILFASKHEDGSVEQYKELLELCQRKV